MYNVGDSPAYLIRNGRIIELTTMDKISGDLLGVTNSVGNGARFSYHTNQISLEPKDKLVLVTDGISDNIYPQEIIDIVINEKTPQNAINRLWELLKKKRFSKQGRDDFFGDFKYDDTTAIIRYC